MQIVDEYVALRVLVGDWPSEVPQDLLGLPYTRHWRLLSAIALPTRGQISRRLALLSPAARDALQRPHPDLLEVLDPRATSLLAADLLRTIGPTSMLIAETLAAAIHHQCAIFFGDRANAGGSVADHAAALGIDLTIVGPTV